MGTDNRLNVKRGESSQTDAALAVEEFKQQVDQAEPTVVIFFCSPSYDLKQLGSAMQKAFPCPVIGCTTAGEVTCNGYISQSLVGASLSTAELEVHPRLITDLSHQDSNQLRKIGEDVKSKLTLAEDFVNEKMFGLLLVDGMSMAEEQLSATLHYAFGEIPLVGGSAGDELAFKETHVYFEGEFHSNAAVITLFETTLPFTVIKSQHFEPTNQRLVITGSEPALRVVKEINGQPAAEAYANLIGLNVDDLNPTVFSVYPVMLKIGGQYYIRSIQKRNPDNSLTFYCAIEDGLVLRIAQAQDLVKELGSELKQLMERQPETQLIVACDCILRRLEIQNKGMDDDVAAVLKDYPVVGFSTYGEQFNSIHVNQTLTAIALGG